ncbi:peptidase M15B and M15C DD-carboxypeptidase VanY/endolysin [Xylanimonas cellulosilytica DSM 15894]|uniref:Peptidase M15B and M15C DD-carboxypeptidase VanY/endolysin n=1 Tax=Xylanimonas cellulosilytica (strain DSM 15894 / JCM 12276 / CECT 5975 / KCTC 9989 / LMG 20990 / NBRC 107835 / XIL07) TaxID=446471 RepID=D1BSG7_XYLCX|nr:M15 family metallopeptidase [Xylanimonas cellulosilytica]ACZ30659.1 peptidase M15B and M15C DD-carboxypeptidase VanY/endolysin [Xylanimonas cellulosilytica DSM 15894]
MPQQYPSRSSVHRPDRPLPAPSDAAGEGRGNRAARRLAARTDVRRRRTQRRRAVQTGSVAAVTSAILIAGVTVDHAASSPRGDTPTAAEGVLVVGTRTGAASRDQERGPAYLVEGPAPAALATPVDAAAQALQKAAELVATEARTSPELREEVIGASAVVLELTRRAEAVEGHEVETTDDEDLSAAVETVIHEASESLGADPEAAPEEPEVVTYALERMVAELEAVLALATPATVDVEPAALTPAQVLAEQAAAGVADAERLSRYETATAGYENGRLPMSVLTPLSWATNHRLRPDAAAQLERLNAAFYAEFGHHMHITSSYRSFAGQVAVRRTHGRMAAIPGTSNHGWGVAVDLGSGINRFGTAAHRWMRANAPKFGWELPGWARENGALPEPWHWEFEGVPTPQG